MPHAALLAIDDCYASSLAGFADILQIANAHLRKRQGSSLQKFEWSFITQSDRPVRASNGLTLQGERIPGRRNFDIVFIPSLHYAGHRPFDALLRSQDASRAWLVEQWQRGAWLAANCTGTFLLGETGLLDGRIATTTWWLEQQFRARFPRARLQLRSVLTEADRLLCAGASASYLIQAIRVVEMFAGPVIASQCAKSMLIDVSQTTQAPYLPLLADRSHHDSVVHRAQHLLQKRMSEEIELRSLAGELAISERTLIRRFQAALEQTPLTYLQHLRIDTARALLEAGDLSVDEIVARVGYRDTSSFSRLFRNRVGMSPGAYRRRFQLSQDSSH